MRICYIDFFSDLIVILPLNKIFVGQLLGEVLYLKKISKKTFADLLVKMTICTYRYHYYGSRIFIKEKR